MVNFFGTAKRKEESSPILAEKEIKASPRIRQSKAMKDLMEKKAEYEKLLEAQELENAVDEKDEARIKRHKARAGRPAQKDVGSTLTRDFQQEERGSMQKKD